MKKLLLLLFVAVLAMGATAQAQAFDPNILFVVGANTLKDDPGPGLHRVQFMFSANAPGLKVANLFGQPLYVGGVGFDLRMIDEAFGDIAGFGLTVPAFTYHIKGGPVVFQAGVVKDVTGTNKTVGFYGAIGTGVTTPSAIAAKRAAKKAKKASEARARELLAMAARDAPATE